MTELHLGDQTIRYDRDATAAVYGTLKRGGLEECGCLFCRNLAVQRDLVYPPSFKTLLDRLGIDPNKEGEAFVLGPVNDGCHLYGGWFYFIGEIVIAGERNYDAPDAHCFDSFFTTAHPNTPAFDVGPVLAVEFSCH